MKDYLHFYAKLADKGEIIKHILSGFYFGIMALLVPPILFIISNLFLDLWKIFFGEGDHFQNLFYLIDPDLKFGMIAGLFLIISTGIYLGMGFKLCKSDIPLSSNWRNLTSYILLFFAWFGSLYIFPLFSAISAFPPESYYFMPIGSWGGCYIFSLRHLLNGIWIFPLVSFSLSSIACILKPRTLAMILMIVNLIIMVIHWTLNAFACL